MPEVNKAWLRDWWGHAFTFGAEPGKCIAVRRDDQGELIAESWPALKRRIEQWLRGRPAVPDVNMGTARVLNWLQLLSAG